MRHRHRAGAVGEASRDIGVHRQTAVAAVREDGDDRRVAAVVAPGSVTEGLFDLMNQLAFATQKINEKAPCEEQADPALIRLPAAAVGHWVEEIISIRIIPSQTVRGFSRAECLSGKGRTGGTVLNM